MAAITQTITPTITLTATATPDQTPPQPSGITTDISGNDITLGWGTVANTDFYNIYYASGPQGKHRTFPGDWTLIATVLPTPGTTSYNYSDVTGNTYTFYAITSVNGAGEGDMSSLSSRVNLPFTFTPGEKNTYRISIPYGHSYSTASDIVIAIEGSLATANKIDNLAIWNPFTQSFNSYSYKFGSWGFGNDWTVDAGSSSSNAVYVHALSNFQWPSGGQDISAGLVFYYDVARSNANKRMLPYSADYQTASDIVLDVEGGLGIGINTKISKVAKWNAQSQSYLSFGYHSSLGWALGTDFELEPGEAINIYPSGNTSVFTWTPKLK